MVQWLEERFLSHTEQSIDQPPYDGIERKLTLVLCSERDITDVLVEGKPWAR